MRDVDDKSFYQKDYPNYLPSILSVFNVDKIHPNDWKALLTYLKVRLTEIDDRNISYKLWNTLGNGRSSMKKLEYIDCFKKFEDEMLKEPCKDVYCDLLYGVWAYMKSNWKHYMIISRPEAPDVLCSICHDNLRADIIDPDTGTIKQVVRTPCNHWFHRKCISAWIQRAESCPYCRAELNVAQLQ